MRSPSSPEAGSPRACLSPADARRRASNRANGHLQDPAGREPLRGGGRIALHDANWCLRTNRWCTRTGVLRYFAAVSRLGDGLFWYALMLGLIAFEGLHGSMAAGHMAATGLASLLLYKLLKRWTRRPRPFASDVRIRAWVAPLDEFSFPSGHTLHAVAFTLVALAYYPILAWLLIPFSASVAVSRVVLGLHYPSDVLAATAIGSGLAGASLWAVPGVALL